MGKNGNGSLNLMYKGNKVNKQVKNEKFSILP